MDGRKIKGVLFDFDDTLVNTSRGIDAAREKVFVEMHKEYGISREKYKEALDETSLEFAKIPAGRRREEFYEIMGEKSGLKLSKKDIARYARLFDEEFINHTEFSIHMEEVIQKLKSSGLKIGILTGPGLSPGQKEKRLKELSIYPLLDVAVVATETIPEPKTDPAAFTKAAGLLGLPPSSILAVGDNPGIDVDNSKKAGMVAALFNTFKKYPDGTGKLKPDYEISDLMQVLDIVKTGGAVQRG